MATGVMESDAERQARLVARARECPWVAPGELLARLEERARLQAAYPGWLVWVDVTGVWSATRCPGAADRVEAESPAALRDALALADAWRPPAVEVDECGRAAPLARRVRRATRQRPAAPAAQVDAAVLSLVLAGLRAL
jgi:hypothetical protein